MTSLSKGQQKKLAKLQAAKDKKAAKKTDEKPAADKKIAKTAESTAPAT